jgi:hypothetical protein
MATSHTEKAMDIEYLSATTFVDQASDRVVINRLPNGRAGFTGTIVASDRQSVFSFTENASATTEEATEAAIAWAAQQGVRLLYILQPNAR